MDNKRSVLSDITNAHSREELATVSDEGRAIVRVISAAIEHLRADMAANHAEASESRQQLETRLSRIEEHLNPDRIAKRAEQDTQLAILWAAAKIIAATVATVIVGGVLALVKLYGG